MAKQAQLVIEDNRRPDIERYLDKLGVSWEYVSNVSPGRFDLDRSLANQARLGKTSTDRTVVARYLQAVRDGDRFPPVLASELDNGSLLVLDGNHRLVAHAEAQVPLDVYICRARPQMLVLITFEANAKHGLPSSEEDRLQHALHLLDNDVSLADASRRLGISQSKLKVAANARTVNRRADDAGVLRGVWDAVPATHRTRLLPIRTDEGFKAMAELVADTRMRLADLIRVMPQVHVVRTSKGQLAVIAELRAEMAEQVQSAAAEARIHLGRAEGRSPKTHLAMLAGQVRTLPNPTMFSGWHELERKDALEKVTTAIETLKAIEEELRD